MSWTWMGVGWIGWTLLLVSTAGVVVTRSDDDLEESRLASISWGVLLSGLGYLLYSHYTATDVENLVSWVVGPGILWIGLGLLAFAGYVWDRSAGDADTPAEMLVSAREGVTQPIMMVAGILTTIIVTVALGITTIGAVTGEILGLFLGWFAMEPGFVSAIVIWISGYVSMGGAVPLVDQWVPEMFRGLGTMYWLGLGMVIVAVGLAFRSSNFAEGAR